MKKFNIEFLIRGDAGQTWVPNKENPVDADDLETVLEILSDTLPKKGIVEIIGVKVTLE